MHQSYGKCRSTEPTECVLQIKDYHLKELDHLRYVSQKHSSHPKWVGKRSKHPK